MRPVTVADLDRQLRDVSERLRRAEDQDDYAAVAVLERRLDELLDRRSTLTR